MAMVMLNIDQFSYQKIFFLAGPMLAFGSVYFVIATVELFVVGPQYGRMRVTSLELTGDPTQAGYCVAIKRMMFLYTNLYCIVSIITSHHVLLTTLASSSVTTVIITFYVRRSS